MSRRTTVRLLITAVVVMVMLLVAVAGQLWFGPSGTGELRHSPDGRYTAHAGNMSTGTVRGDRDRFVEVTVVEQASGREVWRIVHFHPDGADVPDYGARGLKFIVWAADSSSVTVPVAGGRELVLAVP